MNPTVAAYRKSIDAILDTMANDGKLSIMTTQTENGVFSYNIMLANGLNVKLGISHPKDFDDQYIQVYIGIIPFLDCARLFDMAHMCMLADFISETGTKAMWYNVVGDIFQLGNIYTDRHEVSIYDSMAIAQYEVDRGYVTAVLNRLLAVDTTSMSRDRCVKLIRYHISKSYTAWCTATDLYDTDDAVKITDSLFADPLSFIQDDTAKHCSLFSKLLSDLAKLIVSGDMVG